MEVSNLIFVIVILLTLSTHSVRLKDINVENPICYAAAI